MDLSVVWFWAKMDFFGKMHSVSFKKRITVSNKVFADQISIVAAKYIFEWILFSVSMAIQVIYLLNRLVTRTSTTSRYLFEINWINEKSKRMDYNLTAEDKSCFYGRYVDYIQKFTFNQEERMMILDLVDGIKKESYHQQTSKKQIYRILNNCGFSKMHHHRSPI